MKNLLITFFLFAGYNAIAQDAAKQHIQKSHLIINTALLKQYHSPKQDLYHYEDASVADRMPEFLSAENKLSFQLGVEYVYRLPKRFNLSAELKFGLSRFEYNWDINSEYFFDPQININTHSFNINYQKDIPYSSLGINAGYEFQPSAKSKVTITPKAGVSVAYFFDAVTKREMTRLIYQRNDTVFSSPITFTEQGTSRYLLCYNLYISANYPVQTRYIKELRLGVAFMQHLAFRKDIGSAGITHAIYYNSDAEIVGSDSYLNRFRHFSICVGLGL